jgi:uncharacterized protein VirK/YbjX
MSTLRILSHRLPQSLLRLATMVFRPVLPARARVRRFVLSLRGLYALRYWRGQLQLMRVMAHPALIGLVRRRPRLLFKYLHRGYLAFGFDSACRLAILTHHYAFLAGAFRTAFVRTHLAQGLVLWRLPSAPAAVRITLVFSDHDLEGDLMLAFWVGDDWIYTTSVTLAHGGITESGGAPVLLITGLQGAAGKLALIRQATRACAEISPPYLLLAAIKGIAAVLGFKRILGVGNARQLARAAGKAMFDYDRFWASQGGVHDGDGFYQIPAALPEQPAPSPSQGLSREGRKRHLKRGIAEASAQCLRQGMSSPRMPTY